MTSKKAVVNKGVISGIVAILGGAVAIAEALGRTTPSVVGSIISILAGLITTKDSFDMRQKLENFKARFYPASGDVDDTTGV